jgi:cystathionine beta-synthase
MPDGGRPYLSKLYNDNWMIEHGLLERPAPVPTVAEILLAKTVEEPGIPSFVAVGAEQRVSEAINLLQRYSISQLPVTRVQANGDLSSVGDIVGSIQERELLDRIFREGPDALEMAVGDVMAEPLCVIRAEQRVDQIIGDLQAQPAVVVADGDRPTGVITRSDLLEYLAHRR